MGLEAKNPYENDNFVSEEAGQVVDLLLGIDHIGIAVEDLGEAIEDYRDTFGITVDHREELHGDGVEVAVLGVGPDQVHLLAALHEDSPLAAWLDTYGPGVHHVGYRVSDCAAALAAAIAAGHEAADEAPRRGVLDSTVADIEPMTFHGVPVRLVQLEG